jgi:hypothetical protein
MTEIIVGYRPDENLLEQIKTIPQWKQTCHPDQKDDILETNYANGYIIINFSEFIGPGLPDNFRSDYKTDVGYCIVLYPIPESIQKLD